MASIYQNYFSEITPKYLLLVSFYTPRNLLLGYIFKEKGTKVFDIQHSHIYPDHFPYIPPFSNTNVKKAYPDNFLVQGEYYFNILAKSFPENKIIISGKKDIHQIKNLKKETKSILVKNPNKQVILIINQFTITNKIVEFLKNSDRYGTLFFIVKTHPRNIQEQMESLRKLDNNKNVYVSEQDDFYALCNIAHAFIGVYSTGLIDVMKFKKPVFRLNATNHSQFDDLVKSGYLFEVNDLQDLLSKFTMIKNNKIPMNNYYNEFFG